MKLFLVVSALAIALPAAALSQTVEAVTVTARDPAGLLERRPSETVFGVAKPLLETPRAASFASGEALDRYGVRTVDDLIEVITDESSREGERHAHLRRYIGEIAVRSWRGEPGDRKHEVGGCAWIRAVEWMPYQRRTFVTPAFPGYVSGHSTFSRAAATVLATITGSEAFPGGLMSDTFAPGYLFFEQGPSAPVTLEWATYFDAADQAGQSRVWGGIHVPADDFEGRRVGDAVGKSVLSLAESYFDGTAVP